MITLTEPNPPVVDAGTNQTICQGAQITLSAVNPGGANISWSGGITDNVAFTPPVGTTVFTVTATDVNGCQNTDAVTVIVNPLPVVNAGNDIETCLGEAVTLNGSGNATNYSWNNAVINGTSFTPALGTTIYTVTGTDLNGCVNSDNVTVIVNPLPSVNAGVDQSICLGQGATLTASGSGINYIWNNGVSNGVQFFPTQGTFTYIVTATDVEGCQNTDELILTVNSLPNINAGTDVTICEGSGVTLSATGAVSYIWNNGEANGALVTPSLGSSTYSVIGTDGNGCQNSSQFTVTVIPVPVSNFSASPMSGQPPLEVDFTDNSQFGTTYS